MTHFEAGGRIRLFVRRKYGMKIGKNNCRGREMLLTLITAPTEIDSNDTESSFCQCFRLCCPTLLVEPASVSEHDGAVTSSVDIGVDDTSVLGRKGNVLWARAPRQYEGGQSNTQAT